MAPHVSGLETRGLASGAIDVPVRKAEKVLDAYLEATTTFTEASDDLVIGGQSYGGRVASLLVARGDHRWRGLVLFSYPLHRPGHPDGDERSRHWPDIDVPVLFLSGESDPFAKLDLLRGAIDERLPDATLVTYPKQGHSLKAVLEDALDRVAAFAAGLGPR